MSVAGIWAEAPIRQNASEIMLGAFVPALGQAFALLDSVVHVNASAFGRHAMVDASHRSGVRLCGDLRLDEVNELEEGLGVPRGSKSPGWLVLEAYARWGLDFATRLHGDFGFALWDQQSRRLILARDLGGAKPLFYAVPKGAHLAFASHPRGLLALSEVARGFDERATLDYLGEFPQEEGATIFAAVRRVPPGSLLVADEKGLRVTEFFDIRSVPELQLPSDDDYAVLLRDTLQKAVDARIEGRTGVMLSGGLDSSSMATLARRACPETQLTTISAIFPDFAECDERPYQAAVVERIAANHHEIAPSPTSSAGDFARVSRVFGEPACIGPHWLAWEAAERAAILGVQTMLTGIDGDRVVSHGGGRFADLARSRAWGELIRELAAVHDFSWARRARVFAAAALFALLPSAMSERLDAWDPRRRRRLTAYAGLLRRDVLERNGVEERILRLPLRPRSSRDDHARSLRAPDRNWDVELLDQLGTAFGLTFAQPFFDRRVVELCFSFPGKQKRQAGWSRYVLRKALKGIVPDQILERRWDASFDRPYEAWVTGWLRSEPAASLDRLAPYVNVPGVRHSVEELRRGQNRGPVDFLWRCVVLSQWLPGLGLPRPESFL